MMNWCSTTVYLSFSSIKEIEKTSENRWFLLHLVYKPIEYVQIQIEPFVRTYLDEQLLQTSKKDLSYII